LSAVKQAKIWSARSLERRFARRLAHSIQVGKPRFSTELRNMNLAELLRQAAKTKPAKLVRTRTGYAAFACSGTPSYMSFAMRSKDLVAGFAAKTFWSKSSIRLTVNT